MAADTRPYKSKEQDGQGNEVIIRDQQLVEQSTVTTMPSGACFETLDIDGRPVKIPRDNMISIVLECMGIVLNDSSKNLGTNVNKALGLQGNTIGNVTVSDFASVLGGVANGLFFRKMNPASVDLGLVHIVLKGHNYTTIEITVSGTNAAGGVPIKVVVGVGGFASKAAFLNGAGDVYEKVDASGNRDIVVVATTSIDYSYGIVISNTEITAADIINRNGYDLSSYTKIVN